MRIHGLSIGGRIVRHHVAKSFCLPILSFHHPKRLCWSWLIDAYRYRPESGCRHHFFRVCHLPGYQARTIIDVLGLFSVQFIRQRDNMPAVAA